MVDTTVEVPTRVLVFGMTNEDGTLDAPDLHAVADACGQTPDQVRSCLRRMVDEGLYTRSGDGRTAIYRATDDGMAALVTSVDRTRRAYVQDTAGRGWDSRWHLVAFAVPESKRAGRDAFRDRLRALGGANVQGGLYVSPRPWEDEVRQAAKELGLDQLVMLATAESMEVGGERAARQIARQLWPVDELSERYADFVEQHKWIPDRLESLRREHRRIADRDFLPGALAMAVALNSVFERDPLLPPELLPRPWPGRAARDLLLRCRRNALAISQARARPQLFRLFDQALEAIP